MLIGFVEGMDAIKHQGNFWNGKGYILGIKNLNPNDFLGNPVTPSVKKCIKKYKKK